MTEPIDPRARVWDRPVDKLYQKAENRYDAIRNNAALNPDARTAFIAEAFLKYRDAVRAEETRTSATAQANVTDLKRKLFGIDDLLRSASPADRATISISFRDAQARAVALLSEPDPDVAASALLDLARTTGDELLARAIGNAALQPNMWGGVVMPETGMSYINGRPELEPIWEQWQTANKASLDVATVFEFSVAKPLELSAMSDTAIEYAAARAGTLRAAAAADMS